MSEQNEQRWTAHYHGRVQGVGFRYTAKQLARSHDVRGFVQNLSNGQVLLTVEGSESSLERFLAAIADRMAGFITNVDVVRSQATGEFDGFNIRT